jgi:hypothetical protein
MEEITVVADPGDRHEGGIADGVRTSDRLRTSRERYSQLASMPSLPALKSLTQLGNDLLRRTAELPDTEQGLLLVLAEYRYAVFTFVAVAGRV